jgi:hypothetical protein
MDTLLSTQTSIPMFQMIAVLIMITVTLIFGRIKLSLFIGYCAILCWSHIWDLPLFTESSVWKISGPAFLLTAVMIIFVLIAMLSLVYHKE